METGSNRIPSVQEAHATLRQLSKDESAVRYPPLPWWFFIGQAALMASLSLAQLLPPSDSPKAMFVVAVAAVVMGVTQWLNRDGVSWVSMSFRDMGAFVLILLSTFVVCFAIAETTGARWVWIVGAVLGAGIVLRHGYSYRREFNGDA